MPARPSPPPAPGAEPRWAAGAAAEAGIVVLAIPLHKFATLDPSLVAGKIVVDLGSGCRGRLPGGLGVAGLRLGVASRARGRAEAGPPGRRAVGPILLVPPAAVASFGTHRPARGRGRCQGCLLPTTMLAIAHRMPTAKMALPNTKTCGGMPMRVAEYTHTGNGTAEPLTKFEVTKSSMDRANAISAPARIPGLISGRVILRKVTQALAPRSRAASSRERSNPDRRARTVTVTYAMLNITCASSSVVKPLARLIVTNRPSSEAPSTISGAAMFMNITCSTRFLPRNCGGR